MLRSVLAGVTLFALATGPLYAQGPERPEQGDRVRVTLDEGSGGYLVAELQAESLVLRSDPASATFDVPTATLARLEVYRGSTSRLAGFLAGGLAGGVLGTFVAIPCNAGQGHFTCRGIPAGQRILISAGLGALVGFFAWGGRDIWQEVRVPGQLPPATPSRGGRLALGPGASRITREQIASSPIGMPLRSSGGFGPAGCALGSKPHSPPRGLPTPRWRPMGRGASLIQQSIPKSSRTICTSDPIRGDRGDRVHKCHCGYDPIRRWILGRNHPGDHSPLERGRS